MVIMSTSVKYKQLKSKLTFIRHRTLRVIMVQTSSAKGVTTHTRHPSFKGGGATAAAPLGPAAGARSSGGWRSSRGPSGAAAASQRRWVLERLKVWYFRSNMEGRFTMDGEG